MPIIRFVSLCMMIFSFENLIAEEIKTQNMHGIWCATVLNIDWPSTKSLKLDQPERIKIQKEKLTEILDNAKNIGANAIFFQVKPTADALYRSKKLPWSSYLTGTLGKDPGYDPLEFLITEAQKRKIEVHAWFNPYRVAMHTDQDTINSMQHVNEGSPKTVYQEHPNWIKIALNRFVLDPGIPEVQDWIIDVVMEVVENYKINGVHFDDYFYAESDDSKLNDDETFKTYQGNFKDKSDWRRANVTSLIKKLSDKIRKVNPDIKFGISPSGVWRNKADDPNGSNTMAGETNYDSHAADTVLWAKEGYIDYLIPQVYWPIGRKKVPFEVITDWWINALKNTNTQLYIGIALYKAGKNNFIEPQWKKENGAIEIKKQLLYCKKRGIKGTALFSYTNLEDPQLSLVKKTIQQIWKND